MSSENNVVLILDQEFLNRVMVGLGEVASKFSIPVISSIESQVRAAQSGDKAWVERIESHLTGVKLKAAVGATTGTAGANIPASISNESNAEPQTA